MRLPDEILCDMCEDVAVQYPGDICSICQEDMSREAHEDEMDRLAKKCDDC